MPSPRAGRRRLRLRIGLVIALVALNGLVLFSVSPKAWVRCGLKAWLHALGDPQDGLEESASAVQVARQCIDSSQDALSSLHAREGWHTAEDAPPGGWPHVSSCAFCSSCKVTAERVLGRGAGRRRLRAALPAATEQAAGAQLDAGQAGEEAGSQEGGVGDRTASFQQDSSSFRAVARYEERGGAALPNCTRCTGCSHQLAPLNTKARMLGARYTLTGKGASPSMVLQLRSARAPQGKALAKVWCTKPSEPASGEASGSSKAAGSSASGEEPCRPTMMPAQAAKLLGLQQLAADCGLDSVLPHAWVERVRAVLPGHGYVVDGDALLQEIARGVPLQELLVQTPATRMRELLGLLSSVNSSTIVAAAAFDLLASQCDRHPGNVFVDAAGSLALIDNDQALGEAWRYCGADSIFLPGTEKYEILVHGYFWVQRHKFGGDGTEHRPRGYPSPGLLLDYRCHVPGGRLGTKLPPALTTCLKSIDGQSSDELQLRYGFTAGQVAALQQRAHGLLRHGFEWSLREGAPRNPDRLRLPWQPPCCGMVYVGDLTGQPDEFRCTHEWTPDPGDGELLPWLRPDRDVAQLHEEQQQDEKKGRRRASKPVAEEW